MHHSRFVSVAIACAVATLAQSAAGAIVYLTSSTPHMSTLDNNSLPNGQLIFDGSIDYFSPTGLALSFDENTAPTSVTYDATVDSDVAQYDLTGPFDHAILSVGDYLLESHSLHLQAMDARTSNGIDILTFQINDIAVLSGSFNPPTAALTLVWELRPAGFGAGGALNNLDLSQVVFDWETWRDNTVVLAAFADPSSSPPIVADFVTHMIELTSVRVPEPGLAGLALLGLVGLLLRR